MSNLEATTLITHPLHAPESGWIDTTVAATVDGLEYRVQVADDARHEIIWSRIVAPGGQLLRQEAFALDRDDAIEISREVLKAVAVRAAARRPD